MAEFTHEGPVIAFTHLQRAVVESLDLFPDFPESDVERHATPRVHRAANTFYGGAAIFEDEAVLVCRNPVATVIHFHAEARLPRRPGRTSVSRTPPRRQNYRNRTSGPFLSWPSPELRDHWAGIPRRFRAR